MSGVLEKGRRHDQTSGVSSGGACGCEHLVETLELSDVLNGYKNPASVLTALVLFKGRALFRLSI